MTARRRAGPPDATAGPGAGGQAVPFGGFWMAGFEGADHVNGSGTPLDMARASGHLDRLEEDHRRVAQAGLRCVRESIGWRLCEDGSGAIDLGRAVAIQASARRHGLQVLWTLMHYGVPDGLSLHDDALIARLARFAAEVARVLGDGGGPLPPVFTPVNEIGFLAWAAAQPPGLLHAPNSLPDPGSADWHARSLAAGYHVKRRLVRAAIAAMAAVRRVLPRARFLHTEPLVHVVAPRARDDLVEAAARTHGWQWQAWDLLAGRLEPALGGKPQWLDLLGVNHYHSSQWELHTDARLDWATRDPRRQPLSALLAGVWQRYRRPLVLAETSHVGVGRAAWLHDMASEVRAARSEGLPVAGVCLYPAVDRPDWFDPSRWHRSGLWHVDTAPGGALRRCAEPEVLAALKAWQQVLPHSLPAAGGGPQRVLLAFSHLRWDFLRHRARQLLEPLSRCGWRIVFVEEPHPQPSGVPRLDRIAAGPTIDVLVPHTPGGGSGFAPSQLPDLTALLCGWLAAHGIEHPVAWLTTPMAWPLARSLGAARTVYDCGDELAGFVGAPAELAALEAGLLASADAVVAAGTALAAARAAIAGSRLQVLPNAVDPAFLAVNRGAAGRPVDWDGHEAAAVEAALARACGPDGWAGPVIGYAGAVDDRFDTELVAALAAARPAWCFVVVGPVVKVDAAALPRPPNLHWIGAQPHRLLPRLMRRWQVALLPFVRSAATGHANPLKVLEALAAGVPVVATALPDLAPWAHCGLRAVERRPAEPVAQAASNFVQACEAVLALSASERRAQRCRAEARLRRWTWPIAARELATLLDTWTAAPRSDAVGAPAASVGDVPSRLATDADPADDRWAAA